jgi:hypothetical protein
MTLLYLLGVHPDRQDPAPGDDPIAQFLAAVGAALEPVAGLVFLLMVSVVWCVLGRRIIRGKR